MPPGKDTPGWRLADFEEALDRWIELEQPNQDLRLTVTGWVFTRTEDPYQGMHREPELPNLWFGVVPRTAHGDSQVVACSLWIEEATQTVRCDSFATLSWPV